ncbi:MAG: hypothetical protein L0Y64_07770 [Myxococcaceae bacterium]|nr:hypothetical protein [Myxococcaceae bacterium]
MPRAFLLLLLSLAPVAAAGSVYLNGVLIDGTTGVTFEKATVRIDAEGNVHIDAPGYAVKRVDARTGQAVDTPGTRTLSAPARMTRRYWLATEVSAAGLSGYELDVYINGALAQHIRQEDPQLSVEVTRKLRPGENEVRVVARKVSQATPDVGERTPFLRVMLGEGTEQSDRIVLEAPTVVVTRSAAESGNRTQDFVLVTR